MGLKERIHLVSISKYRNVLFGIAIISIMIHHWCENYVAVYDSGLLWMLAEVYVLLIGSVGVEIFLFLSGVGLCYSLKKDESINRFYRRRLIRILPVYLIWGGIYWIIEDIIILRGNVGDVLYDFLFVSFFREGVTRFWYIGMIIPLYFIYPIIYKCFNIEKRQAFVRLIALIFGSVVLTFGVWIISKETYDNIEIALWRIPIFLVGAYMGERLYSEDNFNKGDIFVFVIGIMIKIFACIFTFGMLIGKYVFPNIFRSRLAIAVFSLSLIYLLTGLFENLKCEKVKEFFSKTGSLSLELYITHIAVRAIARLLNFPIYNIVFYCGCMFIAVLVAILVKTTTEVMQDFLRKRGLNTQK